MKSDWPRETCSFRSVVREALGGGHVRRERQLCGGLGDEHSEKELCFGTEFGVAGVQRGPAWLEHPGMETGQEVRFASPQTSQGPLPIIIQLFILSGVSFAGLDSRVHTLAPRYAGAQPGARFPLQVASGLFELMS